MLAAPLPRLKGPSGAADHSDANRSLGVLHVAGVRSCVERGGEVLTGDCLTPCRGGPRGRCHRAGVAALPPHWAGS